MKSSLNNKKKRLGRKSFIFIIRHYSPLNLINNNGIAIIIIFECDTLGAFLSTLYIVLFYCILTTTVQLFFTWGD